MRFNREKFFNGFRQAFGSMDQSQVNGLNFLVDKLESDTFTLPQAAYVLATVKWESANTFQPIKEKRARPGTKLRATQDRYWNTGAYGRGLVQITWPKNYEKFGMPDPVDYDLALKPEKAYLILSVGMREGMFTGKKLSDYVNDRETDYHDARRVVNGTDRADEIASIAVKFERILTASLVSDTQTVVEPPVAIVPVVEDKPKEPTVTTVPSHPPVVEVKSTGVSWTTKISATLAPVGTFFGAVGLKIGGVQVTNGVIITFLIVFAISFAVGAWIYNEGKKREQEKLKWSMDNLANEAKRNVIAKGSA